MLLDINETYNILTEQDRIDITKNQANTQNRFTTRAKGILLQDTYNNPFFQIRPRPRIDTSKMDIIEVYKRYRELYSKSNLDFLPWHYCVEMVQDRFYAFNTRPLDMKFPITNKYAKKLKNYKLWDEPTKLFFNENIFDISEAVHICLIGDSNIDVYTKSLYSIIGNICINPIMRSNKLGGLYNRVFSLNLGIRFNLDYITKFIHS